MAHPRRARGGAVRRGSSRPCPGGGSGSAAGPPPAEGASRPSAGPAGGRAGGPGPPRRRGPPQAGAGAGVRGAGAPPAPRGPSRWGGGGPRAAAERALPAPPRTRIRCGLVQPLRGGRAAPRRPGESPGWLASHGEVGGGRWAVSCAFEARAAGRLRTRYSSCLLSLTCAAIHLFCGKSL